jgi:hypothetical protein
LRRFSPGNPTAGPLALLDRRHDVVDPQDEADSRGPRLNIPAANIALKPGRYAANCAANRRHKNCKHANEYHPFSREPDFSQQSWHIDSLVRRKFGLQPLPYAQMPGKRGSQR